MGIIVKEAKDKLAGEFASENHAGPKDVADFMDLEDEESIEMTKRDAYEQEIGRASCRERV